MDVLSSKAISEKDAAKLLQKFVDAKESEDNADLMVRAAALLLLLLLLTALCEDEATDVTSTTQMNDEVKFQLAQVLEHLEGKKKKSATAAALAADDEESDDDE